MCTFVCVGEQNGLGWCVYMEMMYSFLGTVKFEVPVSTRRQWYDWVKSSGNSIGSIQGLMCVNNITQNQNTSKEEAVGRASMEERKTANFVTDLSSISSSAFCQQYDIGFL